MLSTRKHGRAVEDVGAFSRAMWPRWGLRAYQERVAREIARSVIGGEGRQFAVVFARQSGKDEMLAQLEAYLMCLYKLRGGSIVVANPTFRPQGLIGKRRLLDKLGVVPHAGKVHGSGDYVVRVGKSTCAFLSADPTAQARGETASLMLACNEAQDVEPDRWDAVFDPMGAAHHATQVFSGTVWSSRTLLARQMAYLGELERKDGLRRVFKVGWVTAFTIIAPAPVIIAPFAYDYCAIEFTIIAPFGQNRREPLIVGGRYPKTKTCWC